ncbi:MAG: photosystem I reaction center subunit VIII [Cyanobacteria bacterium P01_F01_bin.33]
MTAAFLPPYLVMIVGLVLPAVAIVSLFLWIEREPSS